MTPGQNLNGSVNGSSSLLDLTTDASQPPQPNTKSNTPRVLFVGWGRAGKDEAAQFAEAHLGLRYGGSFSWHAKEHIAKLLGIHPMTAWETRHKNRQFWKDECDKLRLEDQCFLARKVLADGDICAGLRDRVEFDSVVRERLFDRIVWIERPGTPEDFTVTFTVAEVIAAGGHVIKNEGTLEEYHRKLVNFFLRIGANVRLSEYALSLLK